ncbi:MAG: tachylectin-related carbohydrate-binding protein [Pseudoxanthomonas sp.]
MRRASVVMLACALWPPLAAVAQADAALAPLGGGGGGAFTSRCPQGKVLAGLEIRAGDDIDSVRALCATPLGRDAVDHPVPFTDPFGGDGGSPRGSFVCPDAMPVVTGLRVESEGEDTTIVNGISMYCGKVDRVQPEDPRIAEQFIAPRLGGDADDNHASSGDALCPPGSVAVGIDGRSGVWLDAIGLVCGAPPVVATTAPPPPPPPRPRLARGAMTSARADMRGTLLPVDGNNAPTVPPSSSSTATILYAVDDAGTLRWYGHDGAGDGRFAWRGPKDVQTGFGDYRRIFAGGAGVIYAIDSKGDLLRFRHDGYASGTGGWSGPVRLADGFDRYPQVVSVGHGILYAVNGDGRLLWFRENGRSGDKKGLDKGREVDRGWGGLRIVPAADGVLYAVMRDGTLSRTRHAAWLTGEGRDVPGAWDTRIALGGDWAQFTRVLATDDRILYAIKRDGQLLWYRLDDPEGTPTWQGPRVVGVGWGGMRVLVAQP